ncbi:MAG: hypothetical protein ABJO02_16425 [Reichenbachiella sp.]|uniref:hypothetical protein n=1 Tax=Reichenbachiella sp. TaxID=2184521 RepID=UPI0032985D13
MKLLSNHLTQGIIILSAIIFSRCEKNKSNNELIIGDWIETSKILVENEDSINYTNNQNDYSTGVNRKFNLDGTYFVSYFHGQPYDTGTYFITKDSIFFGEIPYALITLNDSLFIYKKYRLIGNSYYIEKFKKIRYPN